MLLSKFIKHALSSLKTIYPKEEARSLMDLLLKEKYGIEKFKHILEPKFTLTAQQLNFLNSDLARLQKFEPIQYILGKTNFYGRDFNVNKNVLIPRPETEQLCSLALEKLLVEESITGVSRDVTKTEIGKVSGLEEIKVLDLCTGCGCIAWTLALEASSTKVWAVEMSKEALEVASNQPFDPSRKPEFIVADVLAGPQQSPVQGDFDMIISNPPYVRESEKKLMRDNVLEYEPSLALFVEDPNPLIFYKAILEWTKNKLKPGGWLFLEINEAFGKETAAIYSNADFQNVSVVKDFFDKDRFVLAQKCCKISFKNK